MMISWEDLDDDKLGRSWCLGLPTISSSHKARWLAEFLLHLRNSIKPKVSTIVYCISLTATISRWSQALSKKRFGGFTSLNYKFDKVTLWTYRVSSARHFLVSFAMAVRVSKIHTLVVSVVQFHCSDSVIHLALLMDFIAKNQQLH